MEPERIKYAIRLPADRILQDGIGYLLTRPVGRTAATARFSAGVNETAVMSSNKNHARGRVLTARAN